MRAILAGIFLSLFLVGCEAETRSVEDHSVVATLSKSVVELTYKERKVCTAFKIDHRLFMTARHCLIPAESRKKRDELEDGSLQIRYGDEYRNVVSWKLSEGDTDWALFTTDKVSDRDLLFLGCNIPLYLSQPVAMYGYPQHVGPAYVQGYITSFTNAVLGPRSQATFFADFPGGKGGSGSPVVDKRTKRVIGIFTQLHSTVNMSGIHGIENYCETLQ